MKNEKEICPNCKGNGYHRVSWEGDESVMQCETCHSSGDVTQKESLEYYKKTKIRKPFTDY
tara:strand:- start:236 stop:418 length:183 start_codon:yes stop_codon:yes gene_type:complete